MNFGLNQVGGGLSLMRILGSLSKTLGMVRQVAPIYKEVKPLVMKVPALLNKLSGMRYGIRDTTERIANYGSFPSESYTDEDASYSNSGPVFFQ